MAFHVACPITCRRICFCPLGFSRDLQSGDSKAEFLLDVSRIEEFVKDPLGIRVSNGATVQVSVPKILPPQTLVFAGDGGGGGGGGGGAGEVEDAASAQAKRVALQKKAAYAMVAAEDYARRFESGDNAVISSKDAGEEQGVANGNLMCRICFMGEVDGTERARRMLSCKSCGKKYHRNCLKVWAQHRDLFHWSSWTCPSCRICEICQRTGDPTKFMFCKRCDGAYHCYCQHPPHKNVSSGPYLCTKHRRCHSCGSNVPGNGLSVRWFLGYTCCDACGRLFVKGNYCPVCLKVYRDSESTPMVCCDICQRWVHCQCDGISDEKYLQFQVDGNLQYKCATCRGECYQVKDLEDAVQELWRRRDKADQDLIASLRAAAGLPTQEDIFSISPYSDDEENAPPMLKNEMRRSFKLSLKGLADKSPKSNHYGKKYAKKIGKRKGSQVSHISKIGVHNDNLYENSLENSKYDETEDMKQGQDADESPVAGMMNQYSGVSSINQPGGLKHKFVDEVMIPREEKTSRVIKIKSSRHELESGDDTEKHSDKLKSTKAKKLVINLGPRKINVASSPRSDASSGQREHVLTTSNGSGDSEHQTIRKRFKGERHQESAKFSDGDMVNGLGPPKGLKFAGREGNVIKFGKVKYEAPNSNSQVNGGFDGDKHERVPTHGTRILLGKRGSEGSRAAVGLTNELPRSSPKKPMIDGRPDTEGNDDSNDTPILQSLAKDSRFSLKLKIKKPNPENQDSQSTPQMEEKTYVRGQRSKRKRSSVFMEKTPPNEDGDAAQACQDSEMMEANWILKKLGKDAIGKRVEVHQASDNSWHRGVVSDINDNKSMLSVSLDDGRVRSLELGKQAVRFVSQKERRT